MPKIRHTPVIHTVEPEKPPPPVAPVPMKAKGKAAPKAAAAKPKAAAAKAAAKPKAAPKAAAAKSKPGPKPKAQKASSPPSPSNSGGSAAADETEAEAPSEPKAEPPAEAPAAAPVPKKPKEPEFKPPPLPFKHFTFTPPPLSYMNILNNGSAHYTFQPLIPVKWKISDKQANLALNELIAEFKANEKKEEEKRKEIERKEKHEENQDENQDAKQEVKQDAKQEVKQENPKEEEEIRDFIDENDEEEVAPFVFPWDRPQEPIEVADGIYLATYEQACRPDFVRDHKIAFVFSFIKEVPIERQYHCAEPNDTTYYHFDCERSGMSDLIGHFEPIAQIIDWIVVDNNAAVLLHCDGDDYAVCATFVAAYFMQKKKCVDNWQFAMLDLKALPHPMFYEQLVLFERMGARCDPLNTDYRHFKMCAMWLECYNELGLLMGSVPLYELPTIMELFHEFIDKLRPDADTMAELDRQCAYHCASCEAYLFNELNVVKAKDWFVETTSFKKLKALKMIKHKDGALQICNKYYIEPMEWMFWSEDRSQPICTINEENQIACRDCGNVIGLFDLEGAICPTSTSRGSCSKHPDSEYCLFEIYATEIYAKKASLPGEPVIQLNPLPVQQFGFNFMLMQAKEKAKALKEEPEQPIQYEEVQPKILETEIPQVSFTPIERSQGIMDCVVSSGPAGPEQPEPNTEESMVWLSSA